MCICNQTSWKCIKWFKFNREYHPDFVILLYHLGIHKYAIFPQFLFPVSSCGHNGEYTNIIRNVLSTERKCKLRWYSSTLVPVSEDVATAVRTLTPNINNCPTRCNTKQSIYHSASSLYIFRVSTTLNIRSTQNCNYSLRYCSYILCSYLPP